MNNNWTDSTYSYDANVTAANVYGRALPEVIKEFADRILVFRPPKKGDCYVSNSSFSTDVAEKDWLQQYPRFILAPPETILAEYKVTVYARPPRKGEKFVSEEFFPDSYFAVHTGPYDADYNKERAVTVIPLKESSDVR